MSESVKVPPEFAGQDWSEWMAKCEDGEVRMCGLKPRELPCGLLVPEWYETNESCPLVPRDQWATTPDMRPYEWNNRYQNGFPSCCLNSIVGAAEFLMPIKGFAKTALDWLAFWKEVTGGRGGAAVDRALQVAMTKGIPLKDGSGRILITEAWDVPSLEALASGLQRGAMAVSCHDVHAECTVGLVMQGNTPYVQMVNSHYEGLGGQNWLLFPLAKVELSTYGALLIREIEFRLVDSAGLIDVKE